MEPLKKIRQVFSMTQKDFAEELEISQQSLSRAENRSYVTNHFKELVKKLVTNKHPHKKERVLEIINGINTLDEYSFDLKVQQQEEVKEPPEGDAWCFALPFRNALMLDRLASTGENIGLSAMRIADGLIFTEPKTATSNRQSKNYSLYPSVQNPGITEGMVVILGDPERHPASAKIFHSFMGCIRDKQWEFQLNFHDNIPGYFGYPTVLKSLRIKKTTYHPRRYVDEKGPAVSYEDYGIIFSAGLKKLLKGGTNPFGEFASHLVLVYGLHRLATSAGVKLLEDLDFRNSILSGINNFDFPSGKNIGVLPYKVVLKADNRLWAKEPNFKWQSSRITEFTPLVTNWKGKIKD